jgi:hypothetical protein
MTSWCAIESRTSFCLISVTHASRKSLFENYPALKLSELPENYPTEKKHNLISDSLYFFIDYSVTINNLNKFIPD